MPFLAFFSFRFSFSFSSWFLCLSWFWSWFWFWFWFWFWSWFWSFDAMPESATHPGLRFCSPLRYRNGHWQFLLPSPRGAPPLRGTPLREGMARQRFLDNTLTIYVMRQPIPSRRGVAEGRGVSHRRTGGNRGVSHRQTGRNLGVSHRRTIDLCLV